VPSYAPATSPRLRRRHSPWPPEPATLTDPEVPNTAEVLVRIAVQPESTGLELAGDLRGVKTLVPRVHLLLMLAGPRPSGSTGPSRRCRGCLPPSPASPGSGCPQLRYAAATAQRRRSLTSARSHSASWRTRSPSQCPGWLRSVGANGRWWIDNIGWANLGRRRPGRWCARRWVLPDRSGPRCGDLTCGGRINREYGSYTA